MKIPLYPHREIKFPSLCRNLFILFWVVIMSMLIAFAISECRSLNAMMKERELSLETAQKQEAFNVEARAMRAKIMESPSKN